MWKSSRGHLTAKANVRNIPDPVLEVWVKKPSDDPKPQASELTPAILILPNEITHVAETHHPVVLSTKSRSTTKQCCLPAAGDTCNGDQTPKSPWALLLLPKSDVNAEFPYSLNTTIKSIHLVIKLQLSPEYHELREVVTEIDNASKAAPRKFKSPHESQTLLR